MASSSRPLTKGQRAVLELLCAGDWPGAAAARSQLAVAKYAGRSHPGDDNCFDIKVLGEVPLIEGPGGPVYGMIAYDGEEPVGMLDLWVENGRLSSLEHSWFTESPGPLPAPEQLRAGSPPKRPPRSAIIQNRVRRALFRLLGR